MAEDVIAGRVKTEINNNEAEYYGGIGEIPFVANGPPLLGRLISTALKKAVESNGYRWLQIDSLEYETTRQVLGLPVWGNYNYKLYFHGSPLAAPALIVVYAILAGLLAVGVFVTVWKLIAAYETGLEVKKVEKTYDFLDREQQRINNITDPVVRAAAQKRHDEIVGKTVGAITAPGGPLTGKPPSDPLEQFRDIGTLLLWGGIIYLGLTALPSITGAVKSLRPEKAVV